MRAIWAIILVILSTVATSATPLPNSKRGSGETPRASAPQLPWMRVRHLAGGAGQRASTDAVPRTLASADLTNDGLADLAVCYENADSTGTIEIYLANQDVVYPNEPGAVERRLAGIDSTEPLVLSRTIVTGMPATMCAFVDADADGHLDLVTARDGDLFIQVHHGEGAARFAAPERVTVPGTVRLLVASSPLLAIGADTPAGPKIFVHRGGTSFGDKPWMAIDPGETPTAIAFLQDTRRGPSLIVAAGAQIVRCEPLIARSPKSETIGRFDQQVQSLAVTDGGDIALSCADGSVRRLSRDGRKWRETLLREATSGEPGARRRLFPVRIGLSGRDDLLVSDEARTRVLIAGQRNRSDDVALGLEDVVAAVSMRLNDDALEDLVLLSRGARTPVALVSAPLRTFVVNTTLNNDVFDVNPGDGVCRDQNGNCSYNAAIGEANASAGPDRIEFAIPGTGPFLIQAGEAFSSAVTGPVTIDATTQPGYQGAPIVELANQGAASFSNAMNVSASSTMIRGLSITGFTRDVISGAGGRAVAVSQAASDVIVENNLIGITPSGASGPNHRPIETSGRRTIVGGLAPGAANAMAFNDAGLQIGAPASGCSIRGNSIRLNLTRDPLFSPQQPSIDLITSGLRAGLSPNDPGDADTGGNGVQNYPVLLSASVSDGVLSVSGMLDSTPLSMFSLDFYANATCHPFGFGEGERFLGTIDVLTNPAGLASFTASFPFPAGSGAILTALATNEARSTSEFSTCFPIANAGGGATPGLVDPSNGARFLRNANASGSADVMYFFGMGGADVVPIAGDWDGDGVTSTGLYNRATGTFFLKNANANGAADVAFFFGPVNSTLRPIAGDWNGDGRTSVGLYDPGAGAFFLKNENTSGVADIAFFFGGGGMFSPIAGDWDGDGASGVGIVNVATGAFFLRNSTSNGPADFAFFFGVGGAIPVAGDWNGDGVTTVGIYNPMASTWFLRNQNSGGNADVSFAYGPAGAGFTPIAGNWDGQ